MSIILPNNILNGQAIDAIPVMANFNALAAVAAATYPAGPADGGSGGTNPQGGNILSMTLRNLIDNGAFNVAQRYGGTATNAVNGLWPVDRWGSFNSTTARLTFQQLASSIPGFANKLRAVVTAAGTPAAGDIHQVTHAFENLTMAPLNFGTANAAALVLSFTAVCSVAGTYCISVCNYVGSRSFVVPFTLVANTPTRIVIPIPGDTGGAWVGWGASAGWGSVRFNFGAGSSYQTSTVNAWQTGNFATTPTATSLVASPGASFDLYGVQLEVGTAATAFETLPYSYELQRAQRFLPVLGGGSSITDDIGAVLFGTTSAGTASIPFWVPARIPPTGYAVTGGGGVGSFQATTAGATATLNAITFNSAGIRSARVAITQAGATWASAAAGWMLQNAANVGLAFTGAEI